MPRKFHDWKIVQAYYDEGHDFVECALRYGLTRSAWNKAVKRDALRVSRSRCDDRRRRHDWAKVQAYYDQGHTYREAAAHFGFCSAAWYKAIQRGEIKTRPPGKPIQVLLVTGKSRYNIKHRLLRAGLLENRCHECGLVEWRGKVLMAHIDHINGIKSDHRLENLRMLCPNCHSQTETYGGRNARRGRPLQEPMPVL